MEPETLSCSQCGARLPVDGSAQTIVCQYCHAQVLVPEHVWQRFHPPPQPVPFAGPASAPSRGGIWIPIVIAGVVLGGVGVVAALVATAGSSASTVSAAPPNPIAAVGEACKGRKATCSTDGKAELHCGADDKMTILGTCKGPKGCRATADGSSISCDTTYAAVGDPCTTDEDACAVDHKAELACHGGHYAVVATCKGPDGCTLTAATTGSGYTMSCDDHVADVGDPCFSSDRLACSSDKKSLLTCTAQRFAVERTCKRGCVVKKIAGTEKKSMDCL